MQLPYNSPGGYLVLVLFSQFVFFPINGPGWTFGKPWYKDFPRLSYIKIIESNIHWFSNRRHAII